MDVVEVHRRASEEFVRRVRAVRAEDWHRPTPCTEWDVRALVNHVVAEELWTVPLMAGATLEEVGDRFAGDVLGDRPVATAEHAARAAEAAVVTPVLQESRVHLSYGEESATEYAWQLAADHLIHAWDLAVATDGDPRLDPDLVVPVADWFSAREELYRSAGLIAAPPAARTDGDPQDRLLAAFGRDPGWSPNLRVVQDFAAAFTRRDVDAIMQLMADDCVFEATTPPPDGRRLEGAAAVRTEWERLFADTEDAAFDTEEIFVCGNRGVVRWRFSWRPRGAAASHVRGVDVLMMRNGRVTQKLSYVKG